MGCGCADAIVFLVFLRDLGGWACSSLLEGAGEERVPLTAGDFTLPSGEAWCSAAVVKRFDSKEEEKVVERERGINLLDCE